VGLAIGAGTAAAMAIVWPVHLIVITQTMFAELKGHPQCKDPTTHLLQWAIESDQNH
jgi:hypothetical protein